MTSTVNYLPWLLFATTKSLPAYSTGRTYDGYLVNIIIIILFLGILYFGGRLLTKSNIVKVSGRKMEIVERISLGMDRYLLMFKVMDTIYIMMIHKNGSELIDKIPANKFESIDCSETSKKNQFSEVLKKVNQLNKK